ncbi:hypothetical protein HYD42_02345 [Mycoplasmopsis bovis]|nr:hypothetical protein [Mycoplasmopsis bovis]QQH84263.1 hypothetical protein HYD42_02345 [Mycoplasmopsis bovis]
MELDEEKDFYVNLYVIKEFSPIKTQFYCRVIQKHWDLFTKEVIKFRGVIIRRWDLFQLIRRIVDENWFRDVWLRYDEKLNKEYNSENNLWWKISTTIY